VTTTSVPLVNARKSRVLLAHGGGGQLMDELLEEVVRPSLANPLLDGMEDSAVCDVGGARVAFTTDGYVVQPLRFPGGDIGRLAVCGTVNDLAVCGAEPRWISLALIIEEGFSTQELGEIMGSVARAAGEAGVEVVTGDTKVVARGQADGLYITTAGMGVVPAGVSLGVGRVEPGDAILLSGTIADHGLAVMLQREDEASIRSDLASDAAPLNGLTRALLGVADVRFMRDATRGGLSGVLADLAERSGRRLRVDEAAIPIRSETAYAAEMLGLDPLDVANEGKLVAVVPGAEAARALEALRAHELGRDAAIIGRVGDEGDGLCELETDVGGSRVLQKPYGEELPRIC
jgi:hydrogenase expression/formation protein HypE